MLPPQIAIALDRWWSHQVMGKTNWTSQRVTETGRSRARVWRISPPHFSGEALELDLASPLPCLALRSWGWSPAERDRIAAILRFQQRLEMDAGLTIDPPPSGCGQQVAYSPVASRASIIPRVLAWDAKTLVLDADDDLWTLETWLPGRSMVAGATIDDGLLSEGIEYVARMHTIAENWEQARRIPLGFEERRGRLQRWVPNNFNATSLLRFDPRIVDAMERLNRRRIRERERLLTEWQTWLARPWIGHWVIRDLWRENILIDGGHIRGIIDYAAARVDWPGFEIVRWLSSWLAPDDPRLPSLLERYRERRGWRADEAYLTPESFAFLDYLGTLLSLVQWSEWLGEMDEPQLLEPAAVSRIVELDRRLQALSEGR